MQVNSISRVNNNNNVQKRRNVNSQNFKGLGNLPGVIMQGIENSGFIGSFLIQDSIGMTIPRTVEGLKRDLPETKDKEEKNPVKRFCKGCVNFFKNFKNLNFKEGIEVFIREGLSGCLIMFTPVLALLLGKKAIGKTSFVNSSMIKSLGKNFTETAKVGGHADVKAMTKDFYKRNVTKMVQETTNVGDKVAEGKFVDKVVSKLERLDAIGEKMAKATGKKRRIYKKLKTRTEESLDNMFNDFHMSNSANYDMVNKSMFDGKVYGTGNILEGMRGYNRDIIQKGKSVDEITEAFATRKQKQFVASRYILNGLAAASTIGAVSLVPKIYSKINPVPPGALFNVNSTGIKKDTLLKADNVDKAQKGSDSNKKQTVSFKGGMDTIARNFEFNGVQMTPALMLTITALGLFIPRLKTALKRAPEDPNTKKKDYSEIPEVIVRDTVSTGVVTFGVPVLSKALISSYEHKSGFVLQNKPDVPFTRAKNVLDKINPFSKHKPYSLKDLNRIYGQVDNAEKLNNFAQFINKGNGSLAKIFNTSKSAKGIFSEFGLDIKALAKQTDRAAANSTIIDKMSNPEFSKKLVSLMAPEGKNGASEILKRARTLNSVPTFAATCVFIPVLLGFLLPKFVYSMTKKKHNKQDGSTVAQQPINTFEMNSMVSENKIDYTKLMNPKISPAFDGVNKHL